MNKLKWEEIVTQIVFYIISLYILIKILIPIINPLKTAADLSYNQENLLKQILNKSSAAVEVVNDNYEDEDKKELLPLIFKYLTNIDLTNPKTYIASQIPVLQLIDITTILSNDSGPVVVVPREEAKTSDNISPTPTSGGNSGNQADNSPATTVKPNESASIPKKSLNPKKPVVLIFHTHTTEAYNPSKPDWTANDNFSKDLTQGVCKVGEELKNELQNKYGISTIHDMTVHDVPVREGGYKKARPTIQSYLKKYPSIKIVIDLHRDGDVKKNSTTAIINNVTYARTMFVLGSKNKNLSKSKAFAEKLNNILQDEYPGFSKGLYYEKSVFNQDLSSNMALIEVGSNFNTQDEAVRTSKILAKALAEYLK